MDYLLRDIPEGLWDKARHRVIDEKINLKELIIRALEEYLNMDKPKKEKEA